MKITYIYQYFVTPEMAGGSRAYEMARRLVADGHEVNLITSSRDRSWKGGWRTTSEAGIRVHWYPVAYSNYMSVAQRMWAFLRFAWASTLKAASLKSDLVFASSTPLTVAIPAVFSSRRQKCPLVFEVRDLWPEVPIAAGELRGPAKVWLARWLERFAYRNSEQIVALSPGMAEGVIASGIEPNRVHVVPNSCDLERFQPDAEKARRFHAAHPEVGEGKIILYPGTIGRLNDVSYLVDLAQSCSVLKSDIRFVVLGEGAEFELVKEKARSCGVLGRNYFQYGRVAKEAVVDAFAASTMAVSLVADIPEMEMNSANKFFDSLAAGRPVAINYGGWQADLIQEHGVGLVVGRDVAAAAEALVKYLSCNSRVSDAGLAARELAERTFSRDLLYQRLRGVIRRAAAREANTFDQEQVS